MNYLQARADKLVQNEVFCHVGSLVEALNDATDNQFLYDNFNFEPTDEQVAERVEELFPDIKAGEFVPEYERERAYDELRDEFEPLEYWSVSEWLAKKLQAEGEVVADYGLNNIWARTTSGQAIAIDYVIEKIVEDTEYAKTLEDEENKISISWHIEDVKSLDDKLTDEQAREVLHNFQRHHDGSMQSMWEDLQYHVDEFKKEATK